ncbi:uncharacterized protein LOC118735765 isoform X2 [Rhagoletis pomonella]|nr:uncharacterized protein LOC118735765 isoform X2 [Rhagoletis pomonella]
MSLRASSRTTAGDTITPAEKDDLPKNLQASQEDVEKTDSSLLLLRSPSTLLPQIKKEPTLEITDIPATTFNEIRTLTNATELRKRFGSVSADEHCAIKKLKSTQQVISEEHIQLEERVLNNDTLDMNSTDGSYYDLSHLVNGEFDSDIGHNEDEDDEAYHALNVETGKAQDENEFLQLLTKYKLRHHFFKLEELNIDLDCLKSISDMDIKDIFGFDIGARIRFRGLVEEWRAANTNSNTTSGCQMGLDETATKRDIAELKELIRDTHNSLLKAQQKTQIFLKKVTDEDLKSVPAATASQTHCQIGQNFVTNSKRKEVLPKNPYQTVSDFKTFEELLKDSKDLYTNLVDELTTHQFSNSVSFIKSIWRRIMTDNVAQHFCWNGTPEKTAIRTLCVTNALREAYLHKYNYSSNEEFQRTTISFFQYAKARRQLKENYEKFKAASLPL